jgi:xanthosine utilization system XapX-like protein
MIAVKDDMPTPIKGIAAGYAAGLIATGLTAAAFVATCYYLKVNHADTSVFVGAALVYGFVILGVTSFTSRFAQKMGKSSASAAGKRYRRRYMLAMAVYVVALVGGLSADIQYHLTGPVAYACAIAPALPLLAVIAIMGLYLREETDEFERAVLAESALWASGGLLAIATVWGFLELFDLAPHIQSWWAFPIWSFLLGPGQAIARRRYR